ncbi:21034_t:CDS:1, partial [Entrophospora sp. SA101]
MPIWKLRIKVLRTHCRKGRYKNGPAKIEKVQNFPKPINVTQ